MKTKSYTIIRNDYSGKITFKNYKKVEGYKINPKNSFKYKGIAVKSMILIKPSFIEKIVKKKIKRKLDFYLEYLINIEENDEDGNTARESLDELSRYKDAVEYKYRKFLDDRYINLLNKKIALLEREIKMKMANKKTIKVTKIEEQEELQEVRHRRR